MFLLFLFPYFAQLNLKLFLLTLFGYLFNPSLHLYQHFFQLTFYTFILSTSCCHHPLIFSYLKLFINFSTRYHFISTLSNFFPLPSSSSPYPSFILPPFSLNPPQPLKNICSGLFTLAILI